MMRPRAEKKGLSFKVNVNPAIENILYDDSVRIRQVVLNSDGHGLGLGDNQQTR